MREQQCRTLGKIRFDLAVQRRLRHIRRQDCDDGRVPDRGARRLDCQAVALRARATRAAVPQSDDDLEAAVMKIQSVRAPLAAVTNDRDGRTLERAVVDVGLAVHFHLSFPGVVFI